MRFIVVYCNRVECVCISLFKDLVMRRVGCIAVMILLLISSAFADGTKQLWPNTAAEKATPSPTAGKSNNQCFLALGSREGGNGPSRPFARYQHSTKESCDTNNRLYFRIKEGESVCLGFGGYMANGGSASSTPTNGGYGTVQYRICNKNGVVVKAEAALPSSGAGLITTYAQAYYGPNVLEGNSSKGYVPITLTAETLGGAGDYYLEFDIGSDFDKKEGQPFDISLFDVTVIDANKEPQSGRLWSRAWGLNTNGSNKEVWASFYTMSTDGYLSKVYMSGAMPYRFVFGCNSFGSTQVYDSMEKNRQSYPSANTFTPEYAVFLTRPDDDFFGHEAQVPNIPKDLTFAGDAMTCEDLLFVVQLLYNEDATIELLMDTDEDGAPDMLIADLLKANKIAKRWYHYPWKDKDCIKSPGYYYYIPSAATGCIRHYKLSLFDQRFKNGSDTTVYNLGDTSSSHSAAPDIEDFLTGLGTENNPILIRSQSELVALAAAVNGGTPYEYTVKDAFIYNGTPISKTYSISNTDGFSGVHFYLTAPTGSITLESTWPGIGTINNPFKGVFRVGRYNPDPLTDNTNSNYASATGDQDTITFNGASVGLFRYCEGATIDNVHVKGTIAVSSASIYEQDGCINLGGIVGQATDCIIRHCTNACDITDTESITVSPVVVGGIVGYLGSSEGSTQIDSCYNYGKITLTKIAADDSYIGGVAGYAEGPLNFCYNVGNVVSKNATESSYVGGIVGLYNSTDAITSCKNVTYIEGNKAGGIVGAFFNSIVISESENLGTIKGSVLASGIVGDAGSYSEGASISNCLNSGSCSADASSGITTYTEATISSSLIVGDDFTYYNASGSNTTYNQSAEGLASLDTIIIQEDSPFTLEEDGSYTLFSTMCCGKSWRMETAGRLFKSNNSFYIHWDGKNSDGECVTGKLQVRYQKNSGVTHFPFYDPENMNYSEEYDPQRRGGGLKGLVVYRLSPIQDSITKFDSDEYWSSSATDGVDGASVYQRSKYDHETDNAESVYGYTQLPANYYQTTTMSDEYGIELNLYWDDRRIVMSGSCENTDINGYVIGENTLAKTYSGTTPLYYTVTSGSGWWKRSTTYKGCKIGGGYSVCYKTGTASNGDTYCMQYSGKCTNYYEDTLWSTSASCSGIENVTEGGYLGSKGGGHIFPKSNFGNTHTINTWWNGVEVQSLKDLVLTEFSPAVLMPIEISRWVVTNLEESVLLEWTTASEDNNNYFTVERSLDGITWTALGKLQGAGTTSVSHSYSFEDTKPLSGISYYRIRQTDFNGESTCSSVKSVNRPRSQEDLFKAYTIADKNYFVVEGDMIAACAIEVYDVQGRKITKVSYHTAATSRVNIDAGNLPMGTYIIKTCNVSKRVVKNW